MDTASTFSPRAGFFYALGFLTVLAACFAVPRLLSFLPAILGVAGVAYIKYTHKIFPAFDKRIAACFAGLVVWGVISSYWGVDPDYSSQRALKTGAVLFPGLALLAASRSVPANIQYKDRIAVIAAYVCALAGTLLFFEYFSKFFITRSVIDMSYDDMPESMHNGFILNRSTILLGMAAIPAVYMVWTSVLHKNKKYLYSLLMFVPLICCLFVTDSQTAQIAALFAALMIFFPSHRKKARHILLGFVLTLVATAPFLVGPAHDAVVSNIGAVEKGSFLHRASIPHRLEVWNLAAEHIMEKPLFGHGMDAMRFIKADQIMEYMGTDHVMHPHNAVLQIWLEFGAFGILFAIAFVVFLFRRMDALPPLQQRYAMLMFVVMLSILSTGYGLWQAWLLGMMINVTAMMIMAVRINSKL